MAVQIFRRERQKIHPHSFLRDEGRAVRQHETAVLLALVKIRQRVLHRDNANVLGSWSSRDSALFPSRPGWEFSVPTGSVLWRGVRSRG